VSALFKRRDVTQIECKLPPLVASSSINSALKLRTLHVRRNRCGLVGDLESHWESMRCCDKRKRTTFAAVWIVQCLRLAGTEPDLVHKNMWYALSRFGCVHNSVLVLFLSFCYFHRLVTGSHGCCRDL
jgi:hypothetical protein